MASRVILPVGPFTKLQVKKDPTCGNIGFISGADPAARVAHLEHSVRFLQEQHRLMLSGLHAEIEALRERNRDLQFQLIFNKESSGKASTPPAEDNAENNEEKLKREVTRLEREASAARAEVRAAAKAAAKVAAKAAAEAAESRVVQLERLIDAQTEKFQLVEMQPPCSVCGGGVIGGGRGAGGAGGAGAAEGAVAAEGAGAAEGAEESRAELRARLGEAERLVRRLRADAERQRRELQCMKNSLHASLRASGLDAYGYQNNYQCPPIHTPDFWRGPLRGEIAMAGARGRNTGRPLTLPELSGQGMHRSTVYANNHTRPRANGYDKNKKAQTTNGEPATTNAQAPEEPPECRYNATYVRDLANLGNRIMNSKAKYPELKMVVTKILPHSQGNTGSVSEGGRPRARRPHHRKHAADHT